MTEKEMLGTLQLVWDNMGLQMQDREVCGEMREYETFSVK